MAKKIYAKCTNIEGDCIVAKAGKVLEFPAGTSSEDLLCPECSEHLFEVKPPGTDISGVLKKALLVLTPLLIIGLGAWYMLSPEEVEDPLVAREEVQKRDTTENVTVPVVTVDSTAITTTKPAGPDIDEREEPEKNEKLAPTPAEHQPVSANKAYGVVVPGSRRVADCDELWQVWDGAGGKLDRIKRLGGCDCGSEQTFENGYKYRIECENGSRRAVLVSK